MFEHPHGHTFPPRTRPLHRGKCAPTSYDAIRLDKFHHDQLKTEVEQYEDKTAPRRRS